MVKQCSYGRKLKDYESAGSSPTNFVSLIRALSFIKTAKTVLYNRFSEPVMVEIYDSW